MLRSLVGSEMCIRDSDGCIEGHFVGELDRRTTMAVLSPLSIHDLMAVHRATPKSTVVPHLKVMARVRVDTVTWSMSYELRTEVPFVLESYVPYFRREMGITKLAGLEAIALPSHLRDEMETLRAPGKLRQGDEFSIWSQKPPHGGVVRMDGVDESLSPSNHKTKAKIYNPYV
eukprot:TRINITY_DN49998_c0_g1_i2.p1 TRINITY_DN49998_c0_g1~~TRINITY_DN49998_c0_g1_i2.p1  ORF type:complete len:173 (-),score=27.63 TRINITY_DN49998_c0_g1_i2:69-587(-)